jgi:hypothetical protein
MDHLTVKQGHPEYQITCHNRWCFDDPGTRLGVDCSYFKSCEFEYDVQGPAIKKSKPKGK